MCGDSNIDSVTKSQLNDQYQTRHGKSLIDHIITNIPDKVSHCDVIPCETISDHDSPYVIMNVKGEVFAPRYKVIRDYRKFNLREFVNDFSYIPLNVVYALADPREQLALFNKLILDCIENHAPLTKFKLSRPPAPWMKDLQINALQQERNRLRKAAHTTQLSTDWTLFRNVRNKLKKCINETKCSFYRKALSSKRPKEVWNVINRILHPNNKTIKHDPENLNNHFNTVAEKLTNRKSLTSTELHSLIKTFPDNPQIREDCSTGRT